MAQNHLLILKFNRFLPGITSSSPLVPGHYIIVYICPLWKWLRREKNPQNNSISWCYLYIFMNCINRSSLFLLSCWYQRFNLHLQKKILVWDYFIVLYLYIKHISYISHLVFHNMLWWLYIPRKGLFWVE